MEPLSAWPCWPAADTDEDHELSWSVHRELPLLVTRLDFTSGAETDFAVLKLVEEEVNRASCLFFLLRDVMDDTEAFEATFSHFLTWFFCFFLASLR